MIVEEKIDKLFALDLDGLYRIFASQESKKKRQSFFNVLLNVFSGLKRRK
ncbi:MAG: hypothetical protein IJQ99_00500 [Synergistaceae bacterium]|nr:hypothetical protein [Synergistaceae bacterium]